MEQSFPCAIKSDKDLNIYENYLRRQTREENTPEIPKCENETIVSYLKASKGKPVKVETVADGRVVTKIGTLLAVGNDYIVLKMPKSCTTVVLELKGIRCITVMHDKKLF